MIHDTCRLLNRRRNENHFRKRKVSSQLGIVRWKSALGCHKSVGSQNPSCEKRIQRGTFHCCSDRYLHYIHARSTVHWIDFTVLSDRMENIQPVCNASRLPSVAINHLMKNYTNVILTLPRLSICRNVLRFCGRCTRSAYRTTLLTMIKK